MDSAMDDVFDSQLANFLHLFDSVDDFLLPVIWQTISESVQYAVDFVILANTNHERKPEFLLVFRIQFEHLKWLHDRQLI